MYKIIFVDEQQEDIDDFLDYVDKTSTKENFEVVVEPPAKELPDMVEIILKHGADALITDFMLNESKELCDYNVPYTGVELVQELLSIREEFPCFVMTSFDDQAINTSDDVNIIYIKGLLHDTENKNGAKANFLSRVGTQIAHYKARVSNAEKRLVELIALRSQGKATVDEENELIQLDTFLEASIDQRHAIPEEFKSLTNNDRLSEMLLKVDEMLKRLNDAK